MIRFDFYKRIESLFASLKASKFVRDESGVALVAIAVVIGGAALATTTAVLRREAGVQAELRETRNQRVKFDRIQAAIEVYAMQDYGSSGAGSGSETYRLPCPANPADGDGPAPQATTTAPTSMTSLRAFRWTPVSRRNVRSSLAKTRSARAPTALAKWCSGPFSARKTVQPHS